MTRDEIIVLIQEHYDPMPRDWPARHRGWDDGTGDIADKIISRMVTRPVENCSKCGLKADSMLHKFCTRQECPVRGPVVSLHGGNELLEIVNEQAEDEGLWFINPLCSEAYLQAALRRLHAAIESYASASTAIKKGAKGRE